MAERVRAADATAFDPVPIPVKATGGSVPVGTVVVWTVAANPSDMENWLECNGQAITKTDYPDLYAIVGATVPDFQGMFLRGYGSQNFSQYNGGRIGISNTVHASGNIGEIQGDASREITGAFNQDGHADNLYGVLHGPSGAFYEPGKNSGRAVYKDTGWSATIARFAFTSSLVTPVGNENRPVNVAVRYLIRAKP